MGRVGFDSRTFYPWMAGHACLTLRARSGVPLPPRREGATLHRQFVSRARTHTHTHAHTHTNTHTHTRIHAYTHTHTHIHTYTPRPSVLPMRRSMIYPPVSSTHLPSAPNCAEPHSGGDSQRLPVCVCVREREREREKESE
jgi:hypothetical protein